MIISLRNVAIFLMYLVPEISFSQTNPGRTMQLLGKLTPVRTCYEVKHYGITLRVNPDAKEIKGCNVIGFEAMAEISKLQIDFSAVLQIDSIIYDNKPCKFVRDSNATFVFFKKGIKKKSYTKLAVYFSGKPIQAKKAPWDGGFVWSNDSNGNPWVGLACEGIGPSIWLPCKDHWSDEADSMDMHLIVPNGLTGVSNGKLVQVTEEADGYSNYHWRVNNTINTYSISINVGRYIYFNDFYSSQNSDKKNKLMLNYFVLTGNEEKARTHFKQVKTLLACNEKFFGDYPFWEDGYKLVETPYWGMEHQSCVAYGNNYENNSYGFDFIIIHESAHEWFANSITASDPADLWIHESFTTYAEALYVEFTKGYPVAIQYLEEQKKKIKNNGPLVGPRDVYFHGWKSNDIYYKGSWMLHTMRSVLDDDKLWFDALKGFYRQFEHKITDTKSVINYFNKATGRNWNSFFYQYLYVGDLPVFQYRLYTNSDDNLVVQYRWKTNVKRFEMPIKATMTKDKWEIITPLSSWQLIDLNYFDEKDFKIKTDGYLLKVERLP